jgi:hypothetical protein
MVFSFDISFAQIGTSCSNPYLLGVMEGNAFKQQNSSFWIKYELQTDTLQIDFIPLTTNKIDSIVVYTGTCSAKIRLNAIYTANVSDLITYTFVSTNGLHFVELYKDTNNLSPLIKSSIILKSLGGNPIVCDPICPGVSTSCEMICNPSFEHYDSAPDNEGQIERACPWENHGTGTTPDFFHEDYNGVAPNINMDVPINAFDNISEHNGLNGYAGIIAVGTNPDDLYTYHEYLTGKLRFQLQQGLTYYFSTWVYKACISEIQVDELGVYFSSTPVTQNGTDYLNLTPQVSFSNINTNNGNWAHLTGLYTATGNEEYLTFGFFKAGNANNISNTPIAEFCATYPPNGTNNIATNNGSEWAYYFVDDFQLLPNNPIAVEEIEVCYAPTMVTLNAPTNIGNVTWSPGGYTGTTITVPITANYTTYTYTGSIYQGCQVSGIVNITNTQSCCFNEEAGGEVLFAIDGSQSPFYASDLINMNGGNIVSPVGAQNTLLINGEFIVDANLTFTNYLDVQLSTNSKITIRNGITFTIKDFTVLRACDAMWDGIYMNGLSNLNATNIPKLKVFNGVTIQDMENGIVCNNNAIYEIGNHQASVKLNKNYKNITVTGYSDGSSYSAMHPSFVKNCRFTCEASQYTQPDDYLISPHSNQVTFYGVNILKVDNITIGAATPMQSNLFENMNFGIISKNSSINVFNNHFNHITPIGASEDCDCRCREGAAICSAGRAWAFGWPNPVPPVPANNAQIGGLANYEKNSFNDCLVGVQLTSYMNADIIDNSFDNIKIWGVSASNHIPLFSNPSQLNIIQNEFYNISQVYNIITDYTSVTKLIEGNKYNLNTQNILSLQTTAISVTDATNTGVTNLRIDDNLINMVQIGIDCVNQNRAIIDDNTIALATLTYVTNANRSHGIRIDHCNRATLNDNLISADNRDNWWTHGITADYSDDSHIFCNHTYKTGHGIVWSGSYSNPKIYNNNMHRNAAGLTLNWASFGQQLLYSGTNGPAPMYADNIWVGPYANYFHTKVYTCLTCPPIGIMYARPQQGTAYLPNPFYAFSDPPQLELKPELNANLGTLQWIPAEENNHYCNLQSAQETSDILPVSNANLLATENQNIPNSETADGYWWEVYQKYLKLMADTLPDTIAVNWLDSMSNTAIGQLYAVGTNINPQTTDATTIANLQTQNNLISAQTQQEVVFKNANSLWLQALQFLNDSNYVGYPDTSFDFNSVKTIAWECPKSSGPGVFSMRVLANKLDTVWVNYNNDCEQPPNVSEERSSIYYAQAAVNEDETHDYDFLNVNDNDEVIESLKIYPNPNTGSFFINLENVNPSQVVVNVYNALGQNIEAQVQNVTGTIISVDIYKQPKGLYIVEILSNQKIVGHSKLSITE